MAFLLATLLTHAEAQWPMTRGCATQAGIYEGGLPTNLTIDWEVDIDARIAGNLVFVGSLVVAAVQLDQGTFLHGWNRETGELAHVFDEATVQGGAVATTSRILAPSPDDAWVSWNHDGSDFRQFALPARAIGSPALFGSDAFFPLADGIVKVAVDSGEVEWTDNSVGGTLLITPQRVVVAKEYSLVALNHDGTVAWTHAAKEIGSVAVGNGSVFFTVIPGDLRALSLATGEIQWTAPEFVQGAWWATPVYAGGLILLHGSDDTLRAFDATSGAEMWSKRPQEEAFEGAWDGGQKQPHNVPVAADGHRLAFSRHAGGLELRHVSSGEMLESYDMDQASARGSGPVAEGNQIAVPLAESIVMFSGDRNTGTSCTSALRDVQSTPSPDLPETSAVDAPLSIAGLILAITLVTGAKNTRRPGS